MRSPFASAGEDGNAIFSPGIPWNQVRVRLGVDRAEPPTAADGRADDERHAALLADRYQYLADWLTSESIASPMKSPNMISMIGRRPATAAPNAAPASASSEIGVSNTRSDPNRSWMPGRDREHAALFGGDVLAEEHDRLVALHLLDDRLADRGAELESPHGANSVACSACGSGYGAASAASTA